MKSELVRKPVSAGYVAPAIYRFGSIDGDNYFTLSDVERMRRDPQVNMGVRMLCAPLHRAKWDIQCHDSAVQEFVARQVSRFWLRAMPKLARTMVEYGFAVGETEFSDRNRLIQFEDIHDFHPLDVRALEFTEGNNIGEFAGIRLRVANSRRIASQIDIDRSHSFWVPFEAEFGSLFGRSRLAGAFYPWIEKRDRRGAVASRRMWYVKNAYHGGVMRYPFGTTTMDGLEINNQDLARQILEKFETGGVLALPGARDVAGNFEWEYEQPALNGDLNGVLDYIDRLDKEITIGIGIPPELIEAANVGSGYSGRAIPAMMFFNQIDEFASNLMTIFDRKILSRLVVVNFGKVPYHIAIEPFADILGEQQGQQPQLPGSQPGNPLEAATGGASQQPVRMSFGELGTHLGSISPSRQPHMTELNPVKWAPVVGINGKAAWQNVHDRGDVRYSIEKPIKPIEPGGRRKYKRDLQTYKELKAAQRHFNPRPQSHRPTAVVKSVHLSQTDDSDLTSLLGIAKQLRDTIAGLGHMRKDIPALLQRLRRVLKRYEPVLAKTLREAVFGYWLAGAAKVAESVAADSGGPPSSSLLTGIMPDGIRLPLIEAAVADLRARRLLMPDDYAQAESDVKRMAFTVARSANLGIIDRVHKAIGQSVSDGSTLRDFRRSLSGAIDPILAPHQVESLFRTHTLQAYSAGQRALLDHESMRDVFPYVMWTAVHDSRVEPAHLGMERSGIDGTAIYYADDPIWRTHTPPLRWNCRCHLIPLSRHDAASRGLAEAVEWARTDQRPARKPFADPRTLPAKPITDWPTFGKIQAIGHVALSMIDGIDEGEDLLFSWSKYTGPRGGKGWKNSDGTIVYGDDKPGDDGPATGEQESDSLKSLATALPEGARTGKVWKVISAAYTKASEAAFSVVGKLVENQQDIALAIIDTTEDFQKISYTKSADYLLQSTGVPANIWLSMGSHLLAKCATAIKSKLSAKVALSIESIDYDVAAAHVETLLKSMNEAAGFDLDMPSKAEVIAKLKERMNAKESADPNDDRIALSVDAEGHEHKGKGPGGGQFTSTGGGGGDSDDKAKSKPKLESKSKPNSNEKAAAAQKRFDDLMATKSPGDAKAFRAAKADGVAIPPAWTEVVYHGKDKDVLAEGRDDKGRKQRAENPKYRKGLSEQNNARITATLIPKMNAIRNKLKADAAAGNEEAKVLYLISLTGFRIGGAGDGKAKEKAYGASTLTGDHVKVDGDTVTFDFAGKKGVRQQHQVTDPVVAKMMVGAEPGKPIFATRDSKVREAWQDAYGGEKVHDIRHVVAYEQASQALKGFIPPPPTSEAKKKAIIKQVATIAAHKLGNDPAQTLGTYIDPRLWDQVKVVA